MRDYLSISPALPSFLSEAPDLEVDEWIPAGEDSSVDRGAPDMITMARWSMHYLLRNPQRPRGCDCRFSISPLAFPPAPGDDEHDAIVTGDTEQRMELEFVYMREMTGSTDGLDVEAAIRDRLLSYIGEHGLMWCDPRCLAEFHDRRPAAMTWSTSVLLLSTIERYKRDNDAKHLETCATLIKGLRYLTKQRGDMMWYDGGLAGWRDGVWLKACRDHHAIIVNPLVRYWEITGDTAVLEFAEAMSEGIVAGVQPWLDVSDIQPDGSHRSGNCHLVMRAVLGVAQVGQVTGNARFLEWARRVYEFTRANGTDWGWYPENFVIPEHRYRCETCTVGDMVEAALAFANAGYDEYWDHIERAIRNYLPESMFFLTPEYVALYKERHKDNPEHIDIGLKLMRKFEGGCLARLRPNDRVYRNEGKTEMNMMGCCPPEAMRALYIAWRNTIVETDDGVYVNMSLDRDAPAANVHTEAPKRGVLSVEVRKDADFYLRPPSWAPADQVIAQCNGKDVTIDWRRNYVRFAGAKPGDQLEIRYPLPVFTQKIEIGCNRAEETYTHHWIGNDLIEVTPRGTILPMFTGTRPELPPAPDESTWEDFEIVGLKGGKVLSDNDWNPDRT
jgi:hypothetical protein